MSTIARFAWMIDFNDITTATKIRNAITEGCVEELDSDSISMMSCPVGRDAGLCLVEKEFSLIRTMVQGTITYRVYFTRLMRRNSTRRGHRVRLYASSVRERWGKTLNSVAILMRRVHWQFLRNDLGDAWIGSNVIRT